MLCRKHLVVLISVVTLLTLDPQQWPLFADVIVPPQPANQLTAFVDADVTFESASGLYTYTYKVMSAPSSIQEIWFLALEFSGTVTRNIVNSASPRGWSFDVHDNRPIVSWGATEVGPLPPDFVDDGNVVPSPFQIKPGQTLAGFSFQSPDPPDTATFYAEGFTKLPQVTGDVEELPQGGQGVLDFTQNSFVGTIVGPKSIAGTTPFEGGRRPAVDDFLVFLNIAKGETKAAPVAIVIKFALNGETVVRSTFHATLNRIDVTSAFVPSGGTNGDLVGIFNLGSSPLQPGRNVLITSVDGIVPGTTRTASDVDRLVFDVQ